MEKRKGLIGLATACFALSLFGTVLFGALGANGPKTAWANAATFETAQAVSVTGASVTAGADKSGGVPHQGLLIEPQEEKGSYYGNLNAVLPADSKIEFTFPGSLHGNGSSAWIDFTFRFTSVATNEWFEVYTVMINGNWWNSMMVRDMEGHARTTWKWGGGWFDTANDNGYMYPQYGGSDLKSGYLQTVYSGGVLSVNCFTTAEGERNLILAQFDSDAYSAIDNDNQICGLKKMDFSQGYTVSFRANSSGNEPTAPLLIESINGQSFASATWDSEPAWYAAYADIPEIVLEREIGEVYTADEPLCVPSATYSYPVRGEQSYEAEKIELQKDGGAWQSVAAGDTVTQKGTYVLRYTAKEGSTSVKNTLQRTFVVYRDYFDMSDVVSVSGATVTAAADRSGNAPHRGVLVEPKKKTGSYSGEICGVFSGNARIDFTFPGTKNDNGSARQIDFTFRFTDAADVNNYFDVIVANDGWSGWFNAMAVRDKDGHIRTTRYKDGKIFAALSSGEEDSALNNLPFYGGSNESEGYIDLQWNGDVLEIYALNAEGYRYLLAKFDSASYADFNDTDRVYGLQKISFPNGYKVSFSANPKNGESTAPLLIEKINSVALTERFLAPEYMTYESVEYIGGSNRVEVTATRDALEGDALGAGAVFTYSLSIGSLTVQGEKRVYPDLNLTRVEEASYTYEFLDQSVTQTVVTVDTPPVLSLCGIAQESGHRKGGENESRTVLSKSDISAVDLLEGAVSADNIEIYIKGPADETFRAVDEGAFLPDSLGVYEVKYVARDSAGNTAQIVRKIRVIDGEVPVISVNAELPAAATVGSSLLLPSATATDGGQPLDGVTVRVYADGKEISVMNGKVSFTQSGEYRVVYQATDDDGNESRKEYVIVVSDDEEKPTIAEAEIAPIVKTGTKVDLPSMTATDDTDGTVNVTVKVYYGAEEIAVSGGSFVADKEGVYTIVCTSTDRAGNTQERIYEVTSLKKLPTNADKEASGNLWLIVAVAAGAVAVVAIVVVIAVIRRKRRNKKA